MNENVNKEVKKLKPFTRFIYTIGQLPSSYLFSMTYEEQLIWLCNYLAETVIPTVNNNGEAVEELQNLYIELKEYVDNYFENLDVQEEINNKLDEMAESGELIEIISEYLRLSSVLAFDNVAAMKLGDNFIEGSICRTLGYSNYLDKDGAYYRIRTLTSGDVIDEINIIALTNFPTLIAELIDEGADIIYETLNALIADTSLYAGKKVRTLGYNSINDGGDGYYLVREKTETDIPNGGNIVNINENLVAELITNKAILEQFGAVGDGETDDSTAITNCIGYAKTNNLELTCNKSKIYLVSESFDISDLYVDFKNSTFITETSQTAIFIINTDNKGYEIKNIKIDCNNYALCGLKVVKARNLNIRGVNCYNITSCGIQVASGYEVYINDIFMSNSAINGVGIELDTSDCDVSDVVMTSVHKAFRLTKGSNTFTNIHCWIGNSDLINDSIMFSLALASDATIHMSNIYNDTYQDFVKYENNNIGYLYIDNFETQYNQDIYTSGKNNSCIFNVLIDNQNNYVRLTNAFIKGLGSNTEYQHTELTNKNTFYGRLGKVDFANLITKMDYALTDISNLFTVSSNHITKANGVVTINFLASYNGSSIPSSGTIANFAKIHYYLSPSDRIISYCQVTDSVYDYTSSSFGYMYIDRTNEKIDLRLPSGQTGTKYLHINITYVADKAAG